MSTFGAIPGFLEAQFPGVLEITQGKKGLASGLRIQLVAREGHAFVYEPTSVGSSFLLALYPDAGDEHAEVWSPRSLDELEACLRPWAMPQPWTQPKPIDQKKERRRLEKIAAGLERRSGVPCLIPEHRPEFIGLLTEKGRGEYLADLAALSRERLIAHFPPDHAGQLTLKTIVILNVYETHSEPSKGTRLCLAAVGPTKRADTQEIRIELVDLTVLNHAHRWDRDPWYWQRCHFPQSHFWGTDAGGTTEANRLAQASIECLDSGRIIEALNLYGVTLSQELYHLLGGERINPPACCAHPDAEWTARLVGILRQSAPWKIPAAVVVETERLNAWASLKPGRRRRSPSLKILVFPGQPHIRKATLMLTGDRDGQNPRFVIEATGSTARYADSAWKRPIEVDFQRFGVDWPGQSGIGDSGRQ